jgi:hypothetical protein
MIHSALQLETSRIASTTPQRLMLVHESKIGDLLSGKKSPRRWEASGILVRDGLFYVVFDDRSQIARLSSDLQPGPINGVFGADHAKYGFEGITYNSVKGRYYLLVEARKHAKGCYKAGIVEYDEDFNYVKQRPADFTFNSNNKGFEAIAHVQRGGKDFLLALCEGNLCKCGAKGRTPGGGRVQLFEKKRKCWRHVRAIQLPAHLPFADYSGMSADDGRVAIVSQVNSMLWVGQFDEAAWTWRDDGRIYEFPRSENGSIQYGNIEGVGWITPTRIVAVSDRRKKKQQPDDGLTEKDQSIHIFDLPA